MAAGHALRPVWCQSGNPRSAALAVANGWWYGFRSDGNHYAARLGPVALLDSHWEPGRVDWPRHLAAAAEHRPLLATVPDTLSPDELDRTLRQAGELAPYCDSVLVVPKADGVIERLPRAVGGKPVTLGYSVPTSYGGSGLMLWSYRGWPVHLLGGNPRTQAELCGYLGVVSADGNLAWRLARRGVVVKDNGAAGPTLRQADGRRWPGPDAHLEALRRSLVNLRAFWDRVLPGRLDWRAPAAAPAVAPAAGRPP